MSNRSAVQLGDHDARLRIQTRIDENCFVEAGAGTGKTTALIGRLLEIVERDRAEMSEIAAITFTEAAAAELRQRVRDEIVSRIGTRPESTNLRRALAGLEEATITTIHGFAQQILSEYPIEAGLPLQFRVLDEVESTIRASRRFRDCIDRFFDDPGSTDVIATSLAIGLGPNHFLGLLRGIEQQASAVEDSAHTTTSPTVDIAQRVSEAVQQILAAAEEVLVLRDHCIDPEDFLLVRLDELHAALESVRAAEDFAHRLELVENAPVLKVGNRGRKPSWVGCDVGDVRAAALRYEQFKSMALGEVHDMVLRRLIDRFVREAREAARVRWSAGELNFDDLLVLARKLLFNNPDVRGEVSRRIRYLFVDEFQDTDPMQYEIVRLIATESRDGSLHRGKLFLVGDPKQAIYRFRGADIALYEKARRALVTDGFDELRTSYRSVPGIVEWVNASFSQLIGTDDRAVRAAEFSDLLPMRTAETSSSPVIVIGGPDAETNSAQTRREASSRDVASCIATAIGEQWTTGESGELRPLRYSDIAILIPRRTGLDAIEDALDAYAIPYTVSSPALIYASNEIHDLLGCLTALAYPSDERAVVAALRSMMFSCSDEELMVFRSGGGQWRLGAVTPGELNNHRVARMVDELRRLSDRRVELGVDGVLETLVRERRVREAAAAVRRGSEIVRSIDFLIEEARAFVESGGRDLVEFLDWTEQRKLERASAIETQGAARGENVVQILTIHGAKGLEFPFVVLCELNITPRQGPTGVDVLVDGENRIEVRVRVGIETANYAQCEDIARIAEREELRRLVYVGATRARDFLVVALHHAPGSTDGARTIAEELHAASTMAHPIGPTHKRRDPVVPTTTLLAPDEMSKALFSFDDSDYENWTAHRRTLMSKSHAAPVVRASDLVGDVPTPRWKQSRLNVADDDETRADALAWRSPRAASALGRAVHRVLQNAELARGDDIDELAERAAQWEQCGDERATVAAYARSALSSAVIREARASKRYWRELPISYSIGGGMLEGVIDLCFEHGEGLVIVDYKTDAVASPREIEDSVERYGVQLGAYAVALESIVQRPVDRAVIVFLSPPDGAIERDVADLEKEKAAALAVARERLAVAPFAR